MKDLKLALDKLTRVCSKYPQIKLGNTSSDVSYLESFRAKGYKFNGLEFFYLIFKPDNTKIETGFAPIELFSAEYLYKASVGYDGFPDNYIVIGDDFGGGKPLIAVDDNGTVSVYANYDTGEPFKIADSLGDFFFSLAELIDIVYGVYNVFDIADDDDVIKDEFVAAISGVIEPIIGVENFECFYDYFYG